MLQKQGERISSEQGMLILTEPSSDNTQQNNWIHFIYKIHAKFKQKLERFRSSLHPFSEFHILKLESMDKYLKQFSIFQGKIFIRQNFVTNYCTS